MENALELSSPDDISKVFTDKIHCTLTMEQLVDISMKIIDTKSFKNVLSIILPFDLTLSVFNAFLTKYQDKFDGIEFTYYDNSDKRNEHEVYVVRDGIIYNNFYDTRRDCNCLLGVCPTSYKNANDYNSFENNFLLIHSNTSKELIYKCNNPKNGNHVITFDLKEQQSPQFT